jgi:RimJ/RimL family protein N-acetyltransferase
MSNKHNVSIRNYGPINHELTTQWLNDEYLQEAFGLTYKVTVAEHAKWLSNNPQVEFLALYSDDEYIGNIVLTHQKRHFSTYLQIYIGSSAHRGKGLGKSCMKLALDHCFNKLGHNRVWLHVREYNEIAIKLYEGLNFKKEGLERESVFVKGNFLNQICMGLLKREHVLENL